MISYMLIETLLSVIRASENGELFVMQCKFTLDFLNCYGLSDDTTLAN
jgi:hypothetical protein